MRIKNHLLLFLLPLLIAGIGFLHIFEKAVSYHSDNTHNFLQESDPIEIIRPDEIEWGDPPAAFEPGSQLAILEGDPSIEGEVYTFRLRMPPDYFVAPHYHPLPERVVVLEGAFYVGMGEDVDKENAVKLEPGSFFTIPPEVVHFVISGSEGETVLHITGMGPLILNYVNPEDDPRKRGY